MYVDLYTVIRPAAVRFMRLATERQVPLYINVGGDPLDEDTAAVIRTARVSVLQTSIEPSESESPDRVLSRLADQGRAEVTILTLGKDGCLAWADGRFFRLPALAVHILHTHGAGAAFSAGMAYGWVRQWSVKESLKFASTLGSLFCTIRDGWDRLTFEEVRLACPRLCLPEDGEDGQSGCGLTNG